MLRSSQGVHTFNAQFIYLRQDGGRAAAHRHLRCPVVATAAGFNPSVTHAVAESGWQSPFDGVWINLESWLLYSRPAPEVSHCAWFPSPADSHSLEMPSHHCLFFIKEPRSLMGGNKNKRKTISAWLVSSLSRPVNCLGE